MKLTHLISTTEFVLLARQEYQLSESIGNAVKFTQLVTKYAKFMSQKPTLSDFKKYFDNWSSNDDIDGYEVITINGFDIDEEYIETCSNYEYFIDFEFELSDNAIKEMML